MNDTLKTDNAKFSLHSQTAVITGAARGLGLSFAQALASAGANIAVLDVIPPSEELFQLREKYDVKVEYYKTDVTNKEAVYNVVEQIEKQFGGIHIKYDMIRIWKSVEVT